MGDRVYMDGERKEQKKNASVRDGENGKSNGKEKGKEKKIK